MKYTPIRTSYNARYTFSAKEKDSETGYSYFGARYYSSDLSIWLSVDPLADKYPSMSAYTYCADNPVKLVDPNGEDYEVVVDEANKTMTIKATYYAQTESDYKKLQEGLNSWNNQSEKYTLDTENGSYTIKFDLTCQIDAGGYKDAARESNESRGPNCNSFETTDDYWGYQQGDRGTTRNGHQIHVKTDAPKRTVIHEIGHTLGLGEFSGDNAMQQGGNSDYIGKNHVKQILESADIHCGGNFSGGSPQTSPHSQCTSNNTALIGTLKKTK